jgi:primosomal protein N' (replication factor Y) (superfamily II helicase)
MYYTVNLSQDTSSINPYFSHTLIEKIGETLKQKKKVILYLNKRGEFSSLVCKDCQHLYKCSRCDISL